MTRARMYKGLQTGTMTRQSIYTNEREKLIHKDRCAYCGTTDVALTLDHLFARSKSGSDSADNLVYCCQSCNSSKGNRDYFAWIQNNGRSVSVAVAERYLKNAFTYCEQYGILDSGISVAPDNLPFDLASIPVHFPIFCSATALQVEHDNGLANR